MLLATAAAQPGTIREIRGLLLPDDFADRLHSAVFASLAGLAHRNDVVDPVTILWEAQRRRILTAGPYTPDQVLQLCQPIEVLAPGAPGGARRSPPTLRAF
ncbi:DnaB-like helicase N-terminal domain-containing protein [Streptomyces sp. C10]|uniref:DnaB-like helicase N-terminal domain-containing protein n=1 Tax=Streptomyces sp. C10 TaxID=531941 RepID=UPI003980C75D